MPNPARRETTPSPVTLESLRSRIDALDDRLLDLIEQRLALSSSIAAFKRTDGDQRLKLRPRREADIIARLTARAQRAPPELVAGVWRALMSCGLQAQARTEIVMCANGDGDALRRQADDRFGPVASIRLVATPAEALAAARDDEAIAVIEDGLSYVLEPDDSLIVFETLRDHDGTCRGAALGRVAREDAIDLGGGR